MDNQPDLLPEGLEDRLPEAAGVEARVMRAALDAMHSHGFQRVRPPLIEFEESLANRMEGIQSRRMFRFVDPTSLKTLALRSDITVQVGRISATSLADTPRPLRLCYGGQVAVIAANQLEPRRERLQLGAELIGADTVAAASEMVSLAVEALSAAGAEGISVDFTLPDLVDTLAKKALPLDSTAIRRVRRELDQKDAGGLKAVGGEAYLPLIHAAGPFDEAIEKLAAIDAGGALASRIEGLRDIASRVGKSARVTLDPSERHGFEYQSWFGFSVYADGIRGALGRGGTYRIRGKDEAATGFSLYPDMLIDAKRKEVGASDLLYLPLGHDRARAAALRNEGWRTVGALDAGEDPRKLGCTHILQNGDPTAL